MFLSGLVKLLRRSFRERERERGGRGGERDRDRDRETDKNAYTAPTQ